MRLHCCEHIGDVRRVERRMGMKTHARGVLRKYPVKHQCMEMYVEIHRSAKALDDDHRPAPAVPDPSLTRPVAQEAEHRPHARADHRAAQVVVPGESVAQAMREAQDPLAHGHRREHPIDQVRGPLGHPPPATAAEQRNRAKPPARPAAPEKVAKLLLDEPGEPFAIAQIGSLRAECLEVIADHLIQHALRRLPRLIRCRHRGHAGLSAERVPRRGTRKDGGCAGEQASRRAAAQFLPAPARPALAVCRTPGDASRGASTGSRTKARWTAASSSQPRMRPMCSLVQGADSCPKRVSQSTAGGAPLGVQGVQQTSPVRTAWRPVRTDPASPPVTARQASP